MILLGQTYYDREKGIAGLEGLALGALVTHSTKYLTARSRPDSDTKTSFPSGHTQAAFSLATSLWMSYGWSAGLPLAGLGVFTGLTRIADNAHWLSDVVAGATIGILFGRSGFRHHESAAPLVAPMIEIDDADGRVSLLGLQVQQDF